MLQILHVEGFVQFFSAQSWPVAGTACVSVYPHFSQLCFSVPISVQLGATVTVHLLKEQSSVTTLPSSSEQAVHVLVCVPLSLLIQAEYV